MAYAVLLWPRRTWPRLTCVIARKFCKLGGICMLSQCWASSLQLVNETGRLENYIIINSAYSSLILYQVFLLYSRTQQKEKLLWGEVDLLVNFYTTHRRVLTDPLSVNLTSAARLAAWRDIKQSVSALGFEQRAGSEVRKKWWDLSRSVKTEEAARRTHSRDTLLQPTYRHWWGPPPPSATALHERVVILLPSVALEGVKGGVDIFGN